jgi:UDP-N-acetylglucosamine 4-epimerase
MNVYGRAKEALQAEPKRWLITGVAGFIGSNLLELLLRQGQSVIGVDNFSTGRRRNLHEVADLVGKSNWGRFTFVQGDICHLQVCRELCAGVDYVLHQAALGSVPRSIADPLNTNMNNVTGFLNLLQAAKEAGVRRFVFASSSSVYGDHAGLPKVEENLGRCLSPYAVSKRVNELYADAFAACYEIEYFGLRYFNVFGPRQDPAGPYAAVIPKWIHALLRNEPVHINGDGESSRDFCYVANVVQANLLAATTRNSEACNQIYNVAVGGRTTLNELFSMLRERLRLSDVCRSHLKPCYREFRTGDVRHSQADITKARRLLGYEPTHMIGDGLDEAFDWYLASVPGPKTELVQKI